MSATDDLTITSAPDALTRYYYAKEREESAVERINDSYLEALNSLEKLESENAKLRELATFALKHIIEFECEELDRETLRGKPCEDCADFGSSDCPKCMPRMFDVSGIEVDG